MITEKPLTITAHTPITVRRGDNNQVWFESRAKLNNGLYYANVPAGNWSINPLNYKAGPLLPFYKEVSAGRPERRISGVYAIEYERNENKATIDHFNKVITLDSKVNREPEHIRKFVIFHELAHKKFETELKCDILAANKLLSLGYNKPQAIEGRAYLSGKNHPLTIKLKKLYS